MMKCLLFYLSEFCPSLFYYLRFNWNLFFSLTGGAQAKLPPETSRTSWTTTNALSSTLFIIRLIRINWYLRSEEHTSELQSRFDIVCRLLLERNKCINLATIISQ